MPDPAAQIFTQEQVNALLARERKADKARIAKLEAQLGEHETSNAALKAACETLTSERDTARTQLQESKQQHTAALHAHRAAAGKVVIVENLMRADAFAPSIHSALLCFAEATQVEYDDESGAIAAVTYGGERRTPFDAAKAFLQEHPWFAAGGKGGAGTRPRWSGNASPPGSLPTETLSPSELANQGWQEEPR